MNTNVDTIIIGPDNVHWSNDYEEMKCFVNQKANYLHFVHYNRGGFLLLSEVHEAFGDSANLPNLTVYRMSDRFEIALQKRTLSSAFGPMYIVRCKGFCLL